MRQSGSRSGQVRCAVGVRRPRLGSVSHRAPGIALAFLDAFERGASAPLVRLELARVLRQFLRATDYREACEVVVHHPLLLVESASELLQLAIEEAEQRGDTADKAMLINYLRVLRLARETSVLSADDEAEQEG